MKNLNDLEKKDLIRKYNQIINFGLGLTDTVFTNEQLHLIAQFKIKQQFILLNNYNSFINCDADIDNAIVLAEKVLKITK